MATNTKTVQYSHKKGNIFFVGSFYKTFAVTNDRYRVS